ncbi:hypothetical protein B0H34DRAFT_675547 [Crassisporium funariophilum]|nr:hypothetical protein B0H34DRAFT_675547 [Crassisporium funariophilum]
MSRDQGLCKDLDCLATAKKCWPRGPFMRRVQTTWTGFIQFALRDNVLEVAVGLIIATAFTGVVNSLVSDIILPPISLLPFMLRNLEEKFLILRTGPHYTRPQGYNTQMQAIEDGAWEGDQLQGKMVPNVHYLAGWKGRTRNEFLQLQWEDLVNEHPFAGLRITHQKRQGSWIRQATKSWMGVEIPTRFCSCSDLQLGGETFHNLGLTIKVHSFSSKAQIKLAQ